MTQEEKFEYDARRKVLKRTLLFKDDIKDGDSAVIGKFEDKNVQEYTEEGIKRFVKQLRSQRQEINNNLTKQNETIKNTDELGALDGELEELRQKIKKIGLLEQRNQAKEIRETLLKDTTDLAKVHKNLFSALGAHAKEYE